MYLNNLPGLYQLSCYFILGKKSNIRRLILPVIWVFSQGILCELRSSLTCLISRVSFQIAVLYSIVSFNPLATGTISSVSSQKDNRERNRLSIFRKPVHQISQLGIRYSFNHIRICTEYSQAERTKRRESACSIANRNASTRVE